MSNPEAIRTVHVYSMHTDPFAQPGSGDAGGMNVYIARSVHAMRFSLWIAVRRFQLIRPSVSLPSAVLVLFATALTFPQLVAFPRMNWLRLRMSSRKLVWSRRYTPPILFMPIIGCLARLLLALLSSGLFRASGFLFLFSLRPIRQLPLKMHAAAKARHPNRRNATTLSNS